jgi:hypothetical protein
MHPMQALREVVIYIKAWQVEGLEQLPSRAA